MKSKKPVRKKADISSLDTDKVLVQLGERIKALRKEKGFNSYEHFAYDIEISRSGYAKYEAGSDMRFTTLLKIIYGLGMTLDEFFETGF